MKTAKGKRGRSIGSTQAAAKSESRPKWRVKKKALCHTAKHKQSSSTYACIGARTHTHPHPHPHPHIHLALIIIVRLFSKLEILKRNSTPAETTHLSHLRSRASRSLSFPSLCLRDALSSSLPPQEKSFS
eukprot:1146986-Pelagomonas_calceolata.AAC.5